MRKLLLTVLLLAPLVALGQATPVGKWRTFDDRTGKAKSIVQVYEVPNGEIAAKVLTVLQSDKGPHPLCDACTGERHNQPVEGMQIMWGVRQDDGAWGDGKILDPKNGKVYSVKLRPLGDGRKMEVRGFLGISLFGRTQTWVRE